MGKQTGEESKKKKRREIFWKEEERQTDCIIALLVRTSFKQFSKITEQLLHKMLSE